ncbi:glycoside hydrolase family 43 protein [Natronospirillum operosum]|uniref:Glycoside hydrolase family 43 protein n=2 Tax=Natronospirillum operosum TaxID=2759953 RepID=A0A4Z0W362_9GAMM|nr:glycoside hydrolase family 43 protein [Natronospirillum operosum]
MIENPILPGFNADPSICRVGDDYYIATSTFEWYPGVQIHHSKDLVNWTLVTRPLNRADLLDMRGNPDSCGIWAPCLTWSDGRFWLVYTDVKRHTGSFKDAHNYITTCDRIDGDWSKPVYVNSSGFDPSLFHDDDGRKWFLNMRWDHRPNRSPFSGILLQELDPDTLALTGEVHEIFHGSELGMEEGPHLYRRNGYYYLLTAEGGTEYDHACTLARSRSITGPYELHPLTHITTSRTNPEARLQRAGHGDIVETPEGETFLVHLCSRPLRNRGRSPLGRETAIQRMEWRDDDWLWPLEDDPTPRDRVVAPVTGHSSPARPTHCRYDFAEAELPLDFQWLRTPQPEQIFNLKARPGYLRLLGRESLGSLFTSSLVARRQQALCFTATTELDFAPQTFQQMAGLVCYYNSRKYHYLYVSRDADQGRQLNVMSCLARLDGQSEYPLEPDPVALPEQGAILLRAEVRYEHLYFSWALADHPHDWHQLPLKLEYSLLSDEAGTGAGNNFTGAFVGMAAQDTSGQALPADFAWFEYEEK